MEIIYDPKAGKWVTPIIEPLYFANEDDHQAWLSDITNGDFRRTVHAHWRPGVEPPYKVCSYCESTCTAESPYCPECGAKMDENIMPY